MNCTYTWSLASVQWLILYRAFSMDVVCCMYVVDSLYRDMQKTQSVVSSFKIGKTNQGTHKYTVFSCTYITNF